MKEKVLFFLVTGVLLFTETNAGWFEFIIFFTLLLNTFTGFRSNSINVFVFVLRQYTCIHKFMCYCIYFSGERHGYLACI
jgi:hypothetical protein